MDHQPKRQSLCPSHRPYRRNVRHGNCPVCLRWRWHGGIGLYRRRLPGRAAGDGGAAAVSPVSGTNHHGAFSYPVGSMSMQQQGQVKREFQQQNQNAGEPIWSPAFYCNDYSLLKLDNSSLSFSIASKSAGFRVICSRSAMNYGCSIAENSFHLSH